MGEESPPSEFRTKRDTKVWIMKNSIVINLHWQIERHFRLRQQSQVYIPDLGAVEDLVNRSTALLQIPATEGLGDMPTF